MSLKKALLLLALMLLTIPIIIPSYYSLKELSLNTSEKRVLKQVKDNFEQTDRCDPMRCFDHFYLKKIQRADADFKLRNTGGAGILTDCNYNLERQVINNPNSSNNETAPECVCKQGSWIIEFFHGSWLYLHPFKETLTICSS